MSFRMTVDGKEFESKAHYVANRFAVDTVEILMKVTSAVGATLAAIFLFSFGAMIIMPITAASVLINTYLDEANKY